MPELLLVTDAAINIAPTLDDKVDIVQNAIDLALALGIVLPKVGILAAVETVNPKMPSTLDAASLSKMADRGQIRGGIVDGPLAMDNAISLLAARAKGLTSKVAGRADILVAPNLEAGNILAKEFTFAAQAEGAGLVMGAKVPILLTSRSDGEVSRLFSCAVAVLFMHWKTTGRSALAPTLRRRRNDPPPCHAEFRLVVDQVLAVRGRRRAERARRRADRNGGARRAAGGARRRRHGDARGALGRAARPVVSHLRLRSACWRGGRPPFPTSTWSRPGIGWCMAGRSSASP